MNATAGAGSAGSQAADAFFGEPVTIVAVVTIVLSTLFVGMRFWSRGVIIRVISLEDWFLLLGWACATGVSVGNIVQTHHGLGRMYSSLPPATKVSYHKIGFSINLVYAVALTAVKISILFLYLRALRYPPVTLATKIMLAVVIITHAWIVASLLTVCVPLDALWDPARRAAGTFYCHSFSVYWSHAGINIGTDFLIFALPLAILRKLRVPRRHRIALGFVFMLAFSVCIISLARTLQFVRGITKGDRATASIACWTMVEVNLAVICACLTTIKPLLSRMFPRLLGPSSGDGERHTGGEEERGETIGRAPRRKRRNILDSDLLTDDVKDSGLSDSRGEEEFRMEELEAQAGGRYPVSVGIAPIERAATRPGSS